VTTLTVLVPVFNEERSVVTILQRLNEVRKLIPEMSVLIVNDGSRDGTGVALETHSELFDSLVTLETNSGKGEAVRVGLSQITSDYVLIQDADLEYDPSQIPRLWDLVKSYNIDVLLTTRLNGGGLVRVHYFWHKVGNRLITLVFNVLFNTTFTDIYSGYLIFKTSLVDPRVLKVRGWGQQAEILSKLVKSKGKIYEAPISYHGRSYDEGKKIRASAMMGVIAAMIIGRLKKLEK
jgi:glycosyltransferase involved in cell wall biosynthesis